MVAFDRPWFQSVALKLLGEYDLMMRLVACDFNHRFYEKDNLAKLFLNCYALLDRIVGKLKIKFDFMEKIV